MIWQIKTAVQRYKDLPEDATAKTAVRSCKDWAMAQGQKWAALPKGKQQKIVGGVGLAWLMLAAIGLAIPDPSPRSEAPAAVAPTQGSRRSPLTNSGYIGAWSESDLDLVIRAANSNDTEAVGGLIADGRAFWIPANRAVEIESSGGFFGSRIKARFVGDYRYFHTVAEAAK